MAPPQRPGGKGNGIDKDRRRFKCPTCDKTFKRSEHCARHGLMHTQERPFACRYCSKRYGRKDLVRRHERTLHADQCADDPPQNSSMDSQSASGGSVDADANVEDVQEQTRSQGQGQGQGSPPQPEGQPTAEGHVYPREGAEEFYLGDFVFPASMLDFPTSVDNLPSGHGDHGLNTSLPGEASRTPEFDMRRFSPFHIGSLNDPMAANQSLLHLLASAPAGLFPDSRMEEDALRVGNPGAGKLPGWMRERDSSGLSMDLAGPLGGMWSGSSRNLTERLPRIIVNNKATLSPKSMIDEECFHSLHGDVLLRLGPHTPEATLFTSKELQQFLHNYINSFHPHLPILHLPSFSPATTASPLVLAMASIGALYCLKRRRAHELYELAESLISSESYRLSYGPHLSSLWVLQARILLAFFATLSNKQTLASEVFRKMGFFMLEYQWRRIEVQSSVPNRQQMTWSEWIYFEETKRALCGLFIFSDLMLVTFNITPGFMIDRDLLIEIPDHEAMWTAQTAEEWEKAQRLYGDSTSYTLQSVLECLVHVPPEDGAGTEPSQMSGFTALVVMHAVNIYLWHMNQLAQSVSRFSLGIWPHESLCTALLYVATLTLARCQAALVAERPDDWKFAWDDPENILVFNCRAVLRSAHTRLIPPSHTFNRLTLLMDDREMIVSAVKKYAEIPLERTMFVTKVAEKAYEGFLTPVTIGHLLVSKTAALHWSVEQAVAGWDGALFMTKWLHSVEMDREPHPQSEDEVRIVKDVKQLLGEMEIDYEADDGQSLAAIVARACATFLDDVWVWGVTPRMGAILKLLATQYDQRFQSSRATNS